MDYVKALIIKYMMTSLVLWVVLSVFNGVGFGRMLLLSLFITVVGFVLGDLYILPRFENWGGVMADFLLTLAVVWVFAANFTAQAVPAFSVAVVSAIVIAVCEAFFHRYVDSHILHSDYGAGKRKYEEVNHGEKLQTEFGKESHIEKKK